MPKRDSHGQLCSASKSASTSVALSTDEPEYITYLLDPSHNYDCYFVVCNKELSIHERIGAVRKMLLAHSLGLRGVLYDSKSPQPEDIPATDICPHTFRNLLRYIYGFNNITTLSFDHANNLLYTAEKYIIPVLRDKLAVHLAQLLNYENICILMNNPACFNILSLSCNITKILQDETDKVLCSSNFVNLSPVALLKILEQDILSLPEIEVWKATLKWAKHKSGSQEGKVLRRQLNEPLKHIRLCTLSAEDLCKEVIPARVLTDAEVRLITISVGLKEKQSKLTEISNEITCRNSPGDPIVSEVLEAVFTGFEPWSRVKETSLSITTKSCTLELLPFFFTAKPRPSLLDPETTTYQCRCKINITNLSSHASPGVQIHVVHFNEPIKFSDQFSVPIQNNGKNLNLLPNSSYAINIVFSEPIWYYSTDNATYENEHVSISFKWKGGQVYYSPITKLVYKCVTQ